MKLAWVLRHFYFANGMLRPAGYWVVFFMATIILSEWLRAFKNFTLAPDTDSGFFLLGITLFLLSLLFLLLAHHYAQERHEGHLARRLRWFDAWLCYLEGRLHQPVGGATQSDV
jgi:phosphoglycerol transferase MdoB-like AlkP superfamily enzyme